MKIILNPQIVQVVETLRGHFPSDTAATHIINLALRNYLTTLGSNPGNTDDTVQKTQGT